MNPRLPILSPRLSLAVIAAISIIGTVGAARVELEEDVAALLPGRDDNAMAVARKWGLMKKVAVVLGPADGMTDDAFHAAIDAVGSAVESIAGVTRVTCRVDMEKAMAGARVVAVHAPHLYRPEISPVRLEDIPARLSALKHRLASPEALAIQDILLADPLGLSGEVMAGLEGAGAFMGAVVERGHLLSSDRRFGIIVADLGFDPMQVTASRAFTAALDHALAQSKVPAFALGGPHFVVSSAEAMSRDLRMAFGLTAVLVVAIFFGFFRRVRTLPLALLPGGLGILTATAVMGGAGVRLHALTLGFAATITGISVDYVIHLLHRADHEEARASKARMGAALKRVARPVILGCLTTVGAFVIIAMSGFTGIRQLALFSIISLPVALLTTLLLIPAFHRFALRTPREFPRRAIDFAGFARFAKRKGRAGVVVAFAALAGGGIWQVRSVELSGDPRSLGYSDPDITQKESRLREVLPGISRQAILLVSGDDEPQCLERNDRLYTALRERGIPAGHIASVSPLLSARETRETALSAARDLLTREETREAFEAAGFTPEFYASLTVFPPPPDLRDSGFRDSGLADMVEESLGEGWRRGEGRQVITRVRTAGERDIDALQAIARSVPGCRLVSDRLAAREALEMLQRELIWMLAIWLAAAVLLLTLAERSVLFGLRAAVPALFGLVFTVGVFSLLSRPLTPVAAAGLTLVMGLGIDYGIFMQSLGRRGSSSPAGAIAASAFTTMAAFGVLSIARTRAMADIGLIIILGLTAALLAALLLVPALMKGDTR